MTQLLKVGYWLIVGILFVFFFHVDITYIARMSTAYLFENPLDFYESASEYLYKGAKPAANYFPTIFILTASTLLPLKIIGIIQSPESFNIYVVYYLKLILIGLYLLVAREIKTILILMGKNIKKANEAKMIFLLSPFSIFSVIIFAQVDIVYIYLLVLGLKNIIKGNYTYFSILLGIAFTIKFFSIIPFVLLILYFTKNLNKILLQSIIFIAPTLIYTLIYWNSINFQNGVLHWGLKDTVFLFTLNISSLYGGWNLSIFIALFVIAALRIYLNTSEINYGVLIFIFMFSSFFIFLTTIWHPQWILLISPALALSIGYSESKSSLINVTTLTFLGFIGTVFTFFKSNVDMAMFRGYLFNIPFYSQFSVKDLIDIYPPHSFLIYYSIFWASLISILLWAWNEYVKEDLVKK